MLLVYVFVVPYFAVSLLYLYAFLAAIPAAVKCFSMSNRFILRAFTPRLLLLYCALQISFIKYGPLLYPNILLKYTLVPVGFSLIKSTVPFASSMFNILHFKPVVWGIPSAGLLLEPHVADVIL